MSKGKFKVYALQFEYEGDQWGFDLPARDLEDLKARLHLLPNAQILGVIEATVPEDHPAFPFVPTYTKTRNWLLGMLRDLGGDQQPSAELIEEVNKSLPIDPTSLHIPGIEARNCTDKSHFRIITPVGQENLCQAVIGGNQYD